MQKKYSPQLKDRARELRKNMTFEERHLWYDFLKKLPLNVSRQEILGPYIADFYIASAKLVIELDGSQHYFTEGLERDAKRTEFFEKEFGIQVVRIQNTDVKNNFDGVCFYLRDVILKRIPHDPALAAKLEETF